MITVATLFAILLSCRPIGILWDPPLDGNCDVGERTIVIYIQGGESLFALPFTLFIAASTLGLTIALVMAAGYDIILAISPIFLLWKVQVNIHSKVLLCGLLALGFL